MQISISLDTGGLGALEDEAGHRTGKKQKAAPAKAAPHIPPAEDQVRACKSATLPARSAVLFVEGFPRIHTMLLYLGSRNAVVLSVSQVIDLYFWIVWIM